MRKAWDHGDRPPPPFISERPPFRAAAVARRNPPHQRNQRTRLGGGAAVVGGSGLSSGRFTVAGTYFYPINWSEECFISIGYRQESSVSSEKAEKRSNCRMEY